MRLSHEDEIEALVARLADEARSLFAVVFKRLGAGEPVFARGSRGFEAWRGSPPLAAPLVCCAAHLRGHVVSAIGSLVAIALIEMV